MPASASVTAALQQESIGSRGLNLCVAGCSQACNIPMPRKPETHKAPSRAPYKASKVQKNAKLAVSGQVHLLDDDASMRQLALIQPYPSALPTPQKGPSSPI